MSKRYLSIQEQMDHLVADKNIDESSLKERYFKEKTYLDLVSPYTDLIAKDRDKETGDHIYEEKESFQKFLECGYIDDALSCFLRHAIGSFEKSLKSFLMNSYCKKMRDAGDTLAMNYEWIADYKDNKEVLGLMPMNTLLYKGAEVLSLEDDPEVQRRIEALDEILKRSQEDEPSNLMAKHYRQKYRYIPMFVVIHTLSLNKLLTLFKMLPVSDRVDFIKFYLDDYKGKTDAKRVCNLEEEFKRLIIIRNIVNHYEPIFPFILNYYDHNMQELEVTLQRLKNHYERCETKSGLDFRQLQNISFKGNSYSNIKIKKVKIILRIFANNASIEGQ